MKTIMNNKLVSMKVRTTGFINKMRNVLLNRRGEGFVDTAVKVLMAVVIGALVLTGLYLLMKDTVLPTLTERIKEMFDYRG